jgi:hypothetical protein
MAGWIVEVDVCSLWCQGSHERGHIGSIVEAHRVVVCTTLHDSMMHLEIFCGTPSLFFTCTLYASNTIIIDHFSSKPVPVEIEAWG